MSYGADTFQTCMVLTFQSLPHSFSSADVHIVLFPLNTAPFFVLMGFNT